jgi:TatD DNase family protein
MLIDSHAHLTSEKFADEIDAVIQRALEAGIEAIVTISSGADEGRSAIALAERYSGVFATVGIHPHSAEEWDVTTRDALAALACHERVVGIGEAGLDFFYDNAPRDIQIPVFDEQLALARELDLPIVVHSRSADQETIEAIRRSGWHRGILHCFSGGPDLLRAALDAGWYISFAGMITFPRWDLADLLRIVPADRLLVETDSPYLAPVPFRGKRNEPAHVRVTAEKAAELRGVDPAELFATTTENARAIYRLP